jgi:hypothetical protein
VQLALEAKGMLKCDATAKPMHWYRAQAPWLPRFRLSSALWQ